MKAEYKDLCEKCEDEALWNDKSSAQEILKRKSIVGSNLDRLNAIVRDLDYAVELHNLLESESDQSAVAEMEAEVKNLLLSTRDIAKLFEVECLFSGEADENNCFLEINAGAGGTESHDWASMMMRMYLRFAERLGFKTEIMSILDGEEAGIKSCAIRIIGRNAYGWFKTESGVHRLVRISPFNAAGKRMTSFASTWVYPEVNDEIDIEIEEKDLRVDTYRSSGAGGQHVNTTDSAVRITHIPTGVVVQCQSDRSQHKNRAQCMKMLKARLYERELRIREEQANVQNSVKTENGWGYQIRSYVLQPYQMVKDLRTNYETSNTQGVLDGDLEKFVYVSLAEKVGNTRS